jgi:hypothetical protein
MRIIKLRTESPLYFRDSNISCHPLPSLGSLPTLGWSPVLCFASSPAFNPSLDSFADFLDELAHF